MKTGETGLIDWRLMTKRRGRFVGNVQIEPVSNQPLHVDFHQVNLEESNGGGAYSLVGEAPAVVGDEVFGSAFGRSRSGSTADRFAGSFEADISS